jgi:Protein of unknown function (DUF1217)
MPERTQGTLMGISASYLTSLYNSASGGAGSSLLDTLYGLGGQSANASGQTPVQALQSAETNHTQDVAATAAQPTVQHAIAAFTKAVTSATSVAQLLANPQVMTVLLTANGLGDQTAYTALATKALTSDLTDATSLANVLPNTLWKTAATTYNFAQNGLSVIQQPATIASITAAYTQTVWEQSLDASTPGLSSALAFRSQASSITSVDQILGNTTLRNVVTTALGVPQEIAFQSMNAQELAISSRLDITQFKDPKFVESFIDRYLIANSASASATSAPDLTTLSVEA